MCWIGYKCYAKEGEKMKLKDNLTFLFFFKHILVFGLFSSVFITAIWFKDAFIILHDYMIFDIFGIGIIIFALWCLYRVLKIIGFPKFKKEVKG